jgi:hypothetical protein
MYKLKFKGQKQVPNKNVKAGFYWQPSTYICVYEQMSLHLVYQRANPSTLELFLVSI